MPSDSPTKTGTARKWTVWTCDGCENCEPEPGVYIVPETPCGDVSGSLTGRVVREDKVYEGDLTAIARVLEQYQYGECWPFNADGDFDREEIGEVANLILDAVFGGSDVSK